MLPLRQNVCMLVINVDGLLLMGKASKQEGWFFPQGGVEKEGDVSAAVYRELEEELGAPRALFEILYQFSASVEYEFKNKSNPYAHLYRGQSQSYFLVAYRGTDSEITLRSLYDQTAEPEFNDWMWVHPADVQLMTNERNYQRYQGALEELFSLSDLPLVLAPTIVPIKKAI